jgi:hypothetical protein
LPALFAAKSRAQGECSRIMMQMDNLLAISSIPELLSLAVALDARTVPGWSAEEEQAAQSLPALSPTLVTAAREAIECGDDPLGSAYCRLLSAEERRPRGATYTPEAIVSSMVAWAAANLSPRRIVDPGAGSARFLVAAGRRFTEANLVGIELDPVAAILGRGHLAAAGMASRGSILVSDYRTLGLPRIDGKTLFIGNPPYVRHHLIDAQWKTWLVATARKYGLLASQLAGLHVYFFLATAEIAAPSDMGVLITAAEWLDVNYGRLVRELFLGPLGGKSIHVIEPTAMPFPGTATTGVITGFEIGAQPPSIGVNRVPSLDALGSLATDWDVPRERLTSAHRWTPLTRTAKTQQDGYIELGELCRVHRGQVTGANHVWIEGLHSAELPDCVLYRSVTRARELFQTNGALTDTASLKRVIDIPADFDQFDHDQRRQIERFLTIAKSLGADRGFIAEHRKAWWSVGLRTAAPILATYMARRPPVFVRNIAAARHLNIAHGLYPREPMADSTLQALADFLTRSTTLAEGRTYAGGLTKFEPKEMERLMVPGPERLNA